MWRNSEMSYRVGANNEVLVIDNPLVLAMLELSLDIYVAYVMSY